MMSMDVFRSELKCVLMVFSVLCIFIRNLSSYLSIRRCDG